MNQSQDVDITKLSRAAMVVAFVVASVILAYRGFANNLPAIGLMIPLVALACRMIGRPTSLFIFALFVESARITLPGIPSVLGVMGLLEILLFGWMFLDISVRHQKHPYAFQWNPDGWMLLFLANLVLLMMVRGSGFATMGSRTFGGTAYLMMYLTIIFYFAAIHIRMNDSQVKTLLLALLTGTCLPMAVQIAGYISPESIQGASKVIYVQVEQMLEEQLRESEGVVRWNYFSPVAYALIPVAYVLIRKNSVRLVMILLGFGLVAMTGSRSRILYMAAMTFLASIYFSKRRLRTAIQWGIGGLLVFGMLMITAPTLPRAVQRAISFIPIMPVDPAIVERANLSSDWRIELWKNYCIPNIPRYLLIGRGLAHDISGFAWLQSRWYGSSEFFYHMGRYHSGPLTLLLDLGLSGTISFTFFFFVVLADGIRTVRQYATKQDTVASRYYFYLTLLMAYQIFNYCFIFGDVRSSLFRMLMTAAQMRIIKKNFLLSENDQGEKLHALPEKKALVAPL